MFFLEPKIQPGLNIVFLEEAGVGVLSGLKLQFISRAVACKLKQRDIVSGLSSNHRASVRGVTGNLRAVLANASYSVTGRRRALLTTTCSVTGNRRGLLPNAC